MSTRTRTVHTVKLIVKGAPGEPAVADRLATLTGLLNDWRHAHTVQASTIERTSNADDWTGLTVAVTVPGLPDSTAVRARVTELTLFLQAWMGEMPRQAPFPIGALLWFGTESTVAVPPAYTSTVTERSIALYGVETEAQWRDLERALGLERYWLGRWKEWAAGQKKLLFDTDHDIDAAIEWARLHGLTYEVEANTRYEPAADAADAADPGLEDDLRIIRKYGGDE